ncbi:MAG: aminoglycoside phosphotransferase family protein [Gemmatimonadaceae bacterium]|nr:aminoglycoside phosphotransferase family protein [Gemmatimonadaceae bacterium]
MTLDEKSLAGYLKRKKLTGEGEGVLDVRQVGDGLKNLVYVVVTTEQRLVVKQAHWRVQVKQRWWTDRKRLFAEKSCIETLANILPPQVLPEVLLEDRTNFVLVTTAPPRDATVWADELDRGRIDLQIASQAGELLAAVHNQTAEMSDLETLFKETKPFEQLRVEPLYGQVASAFPEIRTAVTAQARALMEGGRCLVLGDLRPRNILIDHGELYLVDFATAHFGQPSFDLGFYAGDMCLKAMLNHPQKAAYLEAINVFWGAYTRTAEYEGTAEVGKAAVRDFGCLLLAQVCGRRPVYEGDEAFRDLAFRISQNLLSTEAEKIEDITESINRTLIDG